jgi:predicted NUDIX family phosphoesterase
MEEVLVVPTALVQACGIQQGFQRVDTPDIANSKFAPIFDLANQSFIPRGIAEHSAEFKQVIPYVLIATYDQGVLNYWRGKGQGEQRLHGKRSCGFGGHINPIDGIDTTTYARAVMRELGEELILTPYPLAVPPVVGFINDDSTEVGKVHFGVVHYYELPEQAAWLAREKDIVALMPTTLDVLVNECSQFETWSQLAIYYLKEEFLMATLAARNAVMEVGQ